MSGHLFIVRGDISTIACDAWLATGAWHGPGSGWRDYLGPCSEDGQPAFPSSSDSTGLQTTTLSPPNVEDRRPFGVDVKRWQRHPDDPQAPQPWFANVTREPASQAMKFLRAAWEQFEATGGIPKHNRAKPLFALPLPGVGKAGHRSKAGKVLSELIPAINGWLGTTGVNVDVALVLWRDAHYHAAQYVRRQTISAWPEIEGHQSVIESLARKAVRGQLVLFLGAGVSQCAGLPGWSDLFKALAAELNVAEETWSQVERLDFMDRAQALEALLEDQLDRRSPSQTFRELIQATIQGYGKRYSLEHGLLASLPASEAVTTNYDELFETACDAAGRARYRIPWEPPNDANRWLLKMHGCVTKPDSIVLSRRDYSRYEAEHGVLGSIVEALLVTRHLLFVGFSMTDPNFRAIFDTVKHAMRHRDEWRSLNAGSADTKLNSEPLGTALSIDSNDVFRRIWQGDVDVVDLAYQGDGGWKDGARRVEIALDCLAAHCCDNADVPLFDTTLFQPGLLPEEDAERLSKVAADLAALQPAIEGIVSENVRKRLGRKVQELLDALGMEGKGPADGG